MGNDGFDPRLCAERHTHVESKMNEHDDRLSEHDSILHNLSVSDAKKTVQIDDLVKSLSGLTKALWGFVATIGAALLGFLIWYIQSL